MKCIAKLTGIIVGLVTLAYGASFLWPVYDWDSRLTSPDGRYDLVVLRQNAIAFGDFSYQAYIFPHALAPEDHDKGERIWLTQRWRGDKYKFYSSYNYPKFRWASTNSIETYLSDVYIEEISLEPVKRFNSSDDPIFISLELGQACNRAVNLPHVPTN